MPSVGLSEPTSVFINIGDVGDKLFVIGEDGDKLLDWGIVDRLSAANIAPGGQLISAGDLAADLGFGMRIVKGILRVAPIRASLSSESTDLLGTVWLLRLAAPARLLRFIDKLLCLNKSA